MYRGNTEIATEESRDARCKATMEVDNSAIGSPKIMFPDEKVVEFLVMVKTTAPPLVIAGIDVATAVHEA